MRFISLQNILPVVLTCSTFIFQGACRPYSGEVAEGQISNTHEILHLNYKRHDAVPNTYEMTLGFLSPYLVQLGKIKSDLDSVRKNIGDNNDDDTIEPFITALERFSSNIQTVADILSQLPKTSQDAVRNADYWRQAFAGDADPAKSSVYIGFALREAVGQSALLDDPDLFVKYGSVELCEHVVGKVQDIQWGNFVFTIRGTYRALGRLVGVSG